MITKNSFVHPTGSQETDIKAPKRSLVNTLESLKRADNGVEWDLSDSGELRILTTSSDKGFLTKPFKSDARAHARAALSTAAIKKALGLATVQITDGETVEFDWGYRVEFKQVHSVRGRKSAVPVRAGYVHVFMSKTGRVFQIDSTLRHGDKPVTLGRLITRAEAILKAKDKLVETLATTKAAEDIARAQSKLGEQLGGIELARAVAGIIEKGIDPAILQEAQGLYREPVATAGDECQLVFSLHEDKMDPVYEIRLSVGSPRQYWAFLVKAKTGEVVHQTNLLHFDGATTSTPASTTQGTRVRSFLRIPDPNVALDEQVKEAVLATLPDPTVLENKDFVIYQGGSKRKVKAKADGTFHYGPKDPEFGCVVTFVWLVIFHDLLVELGMKKPGKQIPVYVGDPSVRDNAYFDPENDEIHLGIGSGLRRGGLREQISHDPGVGGHEYGHRMVAIQTPGKDLPGAEGGAMHESSGDVMGTLLLNYIFRLRFAKELGQTFGIKDIQNDRRVIGEYVLPPDGIRIQRNTKKTPDDKTGEVHDDGLISGGAHADLLEAFCAADPDNLEKALKNFGRVYLMALALVPAHRVTFRDMLRCMITADQNLNNGANRAAIEKAHKDHGITSSQKGTKVPVVIVTTVPTGKRPRRRRRA